MENLVVPAQNDCIETESNDLIQIGGDLLAAARDEITCNKTLHVPIAQLSTLGAGVSSLIPAFNTVTQTTSIATEGLFKLANTAVGDTLKAAQNGNFWGALKTAEGGSKLAQLQAAGPLSATTTTVAAINPATMMMCVALYSIEKELGNIAETGKQILSYLEIEKQSGIRGDVETLMSIINKYKDSWDNYQFTLNNHNQVLDIQRTARKNMNFYQDKLTEKLSAKQLLIAQNKVNSTLKEMEQDFQYYRLSLYTFSLASLLEIMLSGNFKEEYIASIKAEIQARSQAYRHLFGKCSVQLEKMSNSAIEANVLKGIGTAGHAMGQFMEKIPLVNKAPVDGILKDSGDKLKQSAISLEQKAVKEFANISSPQTRTFIDKLDDMIQIYNHTDQIYFDNKDIYLVTK